MHLCKDQKAFSEFLAALFKYRSNFENFGKKEWTLKVDVLSKLRTGKDVVKDICKKSRL